MCVNISFALRNRLVALSECLISGNEPTEEEVSSPSVCMALQYEQLLFALIDELLRLLTDTLWRFRRTPEYKKLKVEWNMRRGLDSANNTL